MPNPTVDLPLAAAAAPTTIIAVHREALDHCLTTRADLRAYATSQGIPSTRLLIPTDGATINLN